MREAGADFGGGAIGARARVRPSLGGEDSDRHSVVHYSTIFKMWVAAATTSLRWFVHVTREEIFPAATSCSAIA